MRKINCKVNLVNYLGYAGCGFPLHSMHYTHWGGGGGVMKELQEAEPKLVIYCIFKNWEITGNMLTNSSPNLSRSTACYISKYHLFALQTLFQHSSPPFIELLRVKKSFCMNCLLFILFFSKTAESANFFSQFQQILSSIRTLEFTFNHKLLDFFSPGQVIKFFTHLCDLKNLKISKISNWPIFYS